MWFSKKKLTNKQVGEISKAKQDQTKVDELLNRLDDQQPQINQLVRRIERRATRNHLADSMRLAMGAPNDRI